MSAAAKLRYVKNSSWLLIALLAVPVTQAVQLYRLSSANTQVSFAVQHLGIQWINARFSDINGEFVLDAAGPASRVDVSIGIGSLDTNQPRWNERLRSREWLDVRRYPRMTYHSRSIELGDQGAVTHGELTLHGVTRPMVLMVSLSNCSAGGTCRFAAHGRIRRSEYGLPHGFWFGGDQVDISISGDLGPSSSAARAEDDRVGQNW